MGLGCSKEKDIQIPEIGEVDADDEGIDAGRVEDYGTQEVREIKVTPEFTILMSQVEGNFYAYGSKCPHYGANLAKGAYLDGIIKCPWHGASFDVRTGDIEDYPSLDCIPSYPVKRDETGKLTVYPNNIGTYTVQRPMCSLQVKQDLYVIFGAGPGGLSAAQTLREIGWDGRIIMITKDDYLPYDRTKLSKSLGIDWDKIKLRDEAWFEAAEIEVMLSANVTSLDVEEQELTIDGMDETVEYHRILIATGMKPRVPISTKNGIIGTDLGNIETLYDLRDSRRIKEKSKGNVVVMMGAGFIAMEILPSLSLLARRVYVIHRSKRPYGITFGDSVGRVVQQHLLKKFGRNVRFICSDAIKKIYGNAKKNVWKIRTLKKRSIRCDLVIFAIGGIPNTDMILPYKPQLENDGFKLPHEPALGMQGGFIPVNEYMETHLRDHYACGDIVTFPCRSSVTTKAQCGHFGMAQKMGHIAALAMADRQPESIIETVPFFWTTVAGVTLRYVGYGEHYNHTVIFGDLNALKFLVLYKRGWKTVAACACNCDPIAAKLSFDLQDNVHYDEEYPEYITSIFTQKPISGDTIFGLKYTYEEDVNEYDLIAHIVQRSWVDRRKKDFKKAARKDVEYIHKPIMSIYEKLFYRKQKKFHRPTKLEIMAKYDPVRLNFQRLALYKDTRFRFARNFAFVRTRRTPTRRPIFY